MANEEILYNLHKKQIFITIILFIDKNRKRKTSTCNRKALLAQMSHYTGKVTQK